MTSKPLLIFPVPTTSTKSNKHGGPNTLHLPSKSQQVTNLNQRISNLEQVLENQNAYLGQNPNNLVTEMILVLETVGLIDDFFKAVKKTPGMEFLAEYQEDILPDQKFYTIDKYGNPSSKPIGSRLFLTMTNRQALRELLSFWNEYKKPESQQVFRRGITKYRDLFSQLKDVRPYGIIDRIKDTGMENYLSEMERFGSERINFEIELAYKSSDEKNEQAFNEVLRLIQINDGKVVGSSRVIIPDIQYHAFIANAPYKCFQDLTESTNVSFLKCQQILYFRPVGQSILKFGEIVESSEQIIISDSESQGEPVIALLDGLPLQNHSLLDSRLIVDDPDDFSANYLASSRLHGTSMASLIIHGDLNAANQVPLKRPIYVRPIMKPFANGLDNGEFLPDDKLPIDMVHRAVKRMFKGDGSISGTAPNIKVINLSIGDSYRPFNLNMSTWAKLIDWLSFKYNVLFVISGGNANDNLLLDTPEASFNVCTPQEIQTLALRSIISEDYNRKILSPAESINAITVGACHEDSCQPNNYLQRKNVLINSKLPSPISRVGFGYNQSVKPEILMPGGVKLFRKYHIQNNSVKTLLKVEDSFPNTPPGNKIAIPGLAGTVSSIGYSCGTSNAAALTSRLAAQLYEMLLELNDEAEDEKKIDSKFFTVIIKCLLAHGANWGEAQDILSNLMSTVPGRPITTPKRHLFPYLGYGCVDTKRILYCTDQRVTLIGYGELTKKENESAHLYKFPLPPSIGAQQIDKKLVITLAWLSPVNFNSSKYRQAHLFFENLQHNDHLNISRPMYDYDGAQKGTLQHDILTGSSADAFIEGDFLSIKVNCRNDASGLSSKEKIAYGLCVTLEIKENETIPIYEEVKSRVQQSIRPRP